MKLRKTALFAAMVSAAIVAGCSYDSVSVSSEDVESKTDPDESVTPSDEPETPGEGAGKEGEQTPETGSYGAACTGDDACSEGLSCLNGICGREDGLGAECSESAPCASGTCQDGACRKTLAAGDDCDGIYLLCGEEMRCEEVYGTRYCANVGGAGEACDDDLNVCDIGMECDLAQGVCIHVGEAGETCDGVYNLCVSGLQCRSGYCRETALEGAECDAETKPCDSLTAVCYDNKCIESSECKDDSDCLADTYCCMEDACTTKGVCLPYGEGPRETVNEACVYETIPGLFEADIQCEWLGDDENMEQAGYNYVVVMPVVAKTPHKAAGDANTIIAMTYQYGNLGFHGKCASAYSYATIYKGKTPTDEEAKAKFDELSKASRFTRCRKSGTNKAIDYTAWKAGKVEYNQDDPYDLGVIRFINGENCNLMESLWDDEIPFHGGMPPTVGDVDNDGNVEIFVQAAKINEDDGARQLLAYHWNDEKQKYTRWWASPASGSEAVVRGLSNSPLSLHDVNNDGKPELINASGEVVDSLTGKVLNKKPPTTCTGCLIRISMGGFTTLGDFDADGVIEAAQGKGVSSSTWACSGDKPKVYEWDSENNYWVPDWEFPDCNRTALAYGDFGTPGPTPEAFNWDVLDGKAEIVSANGSVSSSPVTARGWVYIDAVYEAEDGTKTGQRVFSYGGIRVNEGVTTEDEGIYGGGAPTVGDFDGDGLPEVAVATGDRYMVFDPRCKTGKEAGCESRGVLWTKKSQDVSSYATSSSLFDFEGDGAMEVVYADECYTRVYDGKTGEVHFSSRTNSRTWVEMPIIVDVDNDESAEIIVGSNQTMTCDVVDPIHRGIKCEKDADCTTGSCENNLCRCTDDSQCNWREGKKGILQEYYCTDPLPEDATVNASKVCRARHEKTDQTTGIRVMRDKLDRWASSRNIWNQQSYNITNINDDQTIPKTSEWVKNQNFATPGLNNYRANRQGLVGKNAAPDITGKLNKENLCRKNGDTGGITLTGQICNRGTKMVASKMPASFYKVNEDGSLGDKYCTAYTEANVPVGGCMDVSCTMNEIVEGIRVRMISNDDGAGGRTTVECNDQNNSDEIVLEACQIL